MGGRSLRLVGVGAICSFITSVFACNQAGSPVRSPEHTGLTSPSPVPAPLNAAPPLLGTTTTDAFSRCLAGVGGGSCFSGAAPPQSTVSNAALGRCLSGAGDADCFDAPSIHSRRLQLASAAPGAPTALTASVSINRFNGSGAVTLHWFVPVGGDPLDYYVIEAGSGPGLVNLARFSITGTPSGPGVVLTTEFAYFTSGVPVGTYYVRVRAGNAFGVSAASNEIVVVIAPCVTPGVAALEFFTHSGGAVTLSWTTAPGLPLTYVIEAGSAPALTNLASIDAGNRGVFTASNVPPGTYYVRIRARNFCGTGAPSNEVVVTVGP